MASIVTNAPLEVQQLKQFGDGRDLVGFLFGRDLPQGEGVLGGPGADQVQSLDAARGAARAPGRLAVDGDVADLQAVTQGGEPGEQTALQSQRVEAVEDALEGVVAGHAVVWIEETGQPVAAALGEGLDLLPGVGAGDDGAQGDDDDVEQAMTLAVLASGVTQLGEVVPDGQDAGGGHASVP